MCSFCLISYQAISSIPVSCKIVIKWTTTWILRDLHVITFFLFVCLLRQHLWQPDLLLIPCFFLALYYDCNFCMKYSIFFTQCLTRALRDEHPRLLMAASTLLLPFQPLMVTALHTGMMEASIFSKLSCHVTFRIIDHPREDLFLRFLTYSSMVFPSKWHTRVLFCLRFHLRNEHPQSQSSRRHITCTGCRLCWVVRCSSPMMSSRRPPTSMLHGI